MLEKIVFRLVSHKKKALILACFLLVGMIAFMRPLVFDGKLSGFYIKDNPYHKASQRMSEIFSADKTVYILITPESVSSLIIFQSLGKLENELLNSFHGIRCQSIHQALPLFRLTLNIKGSIQEILSGASSIPLVRDLISIDKRSFLMIARISPEVNFKLDEFNQIINKKYSGIKSIKAISQYHIQNEIENSLIKDLVTLSLVTLFFLIIFISFIYRKISAFIYLFINILISIIPVFFFFSVFNIKVNLITVLVIPIAFVLSLADAIHLLTGYNQITPKEDKDVQIRKTLRLYFIPSMLTSITTAIAFFSFVFNDSVYIRQFGLLTSMCVICEFVFTFLIAPFLLHFVKQEDVPNKEIAKMVGFFIKHQKSFSFGLLTLLLVSVFFISGISFKTNFDMFIPVNSQVYNDQVEFKKSFQSLIEMDIFIEENNPQNNDPGLKKDRELLNTTIKFVEEINNLKEVVSVNSIKDQLEFETKYNFMGMNLLKFPIKNNPYVSSDQKIYRINIKFNEPGNVKAFDRKISKAFEKYEPDYKITVSCAALLIDYIDTRMAKSLLKSLLFSGFLIFLILLVLTRKIMLTFISLIANLIPLGCIILILNIFNLDINTLTAITGVVCVGLIVDDTIHVLYRKLRLSISLQELAFGMLNTSLILFGAFLVYILSSFRPTKVFGYTSAIVFLVTVISDLTVLPWLIKMWQSFTRKTA